jgi:UDP-N-acetyl-D-mannosaminuronate dehydrogenase
MQEKLQEHNARLQKTGKNPQNSTLAVLGAAYKANINDPRQSPSKPIIQKLTKLGAKVNAYDPHCIETFGTQKANNLKNAIKNANLKEIKKLIENKPAVIDGRRIINLHKAEKLGFIYYGVGYGKSRVKGEPC